MYTRNYGEGHSCAAIGEPSVVEIGVGRARIYDVVGGGCGGFERIFGGMP